MTDLGFDDAALRSAMTAYLDTATRLDDISAVGGEARNVLDLAEAKTLAAMRLRKRLTELGWAAPVTERASL
jgi:hypothetical protein